MQYTKLETTTLCMPYTCIRLPMK